jgi:site-specific recombinase XerD
MISILEEFKKQMKRDDLTENTIKNTIADIRNFAKFMKIDPEKLNKHMINSFTEKQLENYINYLKSNYKSATAIRRKISLQKLLKFTGSKKLDFFLENLKIKHIKPDTYFPSDAEVQTLFDDVMSNGNPTQKCAMMIIKNTGMRISEVSNLNISNIDFEKLTISLYDTKNKKDRKLPVSQTVIDHIRHYIDNDRKKPRSSKNEGADALFISKMGLRHSNLCALLQPFYDKYGFTTHGVRKQVSTKIYKITGCDVKTTCHFMGNSPQTLMERYIKVDQEKLDSIRDKL